jgi:hypothetical protein
MGDCHLLDANNVKTIAHQSIRYVFCRGVVWQVACHCLHGYFGFGVKCVIGQVIGVKVGFDILEIRHASHDDSGSVSSATELKGFFDHTLHLLLQMNQVRGRH